MTVVLRRRFGVWAALAMIVTEVMDIGVFLTPAGMSRTLGSTGLVLAVWGRSWDCSPLQARSSTPT